MTGPHRDVAAARHHLRTCIRTHLPDLPLSGEVILVGCSGGQDSLALAATLAFCAPRDGYRVHAVIIDHQVREESADDASRAAAACAQLGLPAEVRQVRVPGGRQGSGHGGPEAAARTARRAALAAAAADHNARAVLLGHTLDDQAETVLLGLARGSGARSLAGMRERDGLWLRPFLGLRRAHTAAICEELALPVVADPSNDVDGPWRQADGRPLRRTALRARAIPALREVLGPGVDLALARTATQLQRDDDYLQVLAQEALDTVVVGENPTCLAQAATAALPAAIRTRVLHMVLARAARPGEQVTAEQVEQVDRLVRLRAVHGPIYCAGGVIVTKENGMLTVAANEGGIGAR